MNMPFLKSDIAEIAQHLGEAVQAFSGKTIVMSGARGFLGRYFTETFDYLNQHVLKEPCRFIGLDNLLTAGEAGAKIDDRPNFKFVNCDVCKPLELEENRVDYVIHAAGIASPFYYRAYPLETLDVAINGTRNMLELATKHQARMTFFSSSEIYGDPDPRHVPTPESYRGSVSCRGPRACYDESKRVGETLCHIYHEKFGTVSTTIRPFNVYGPGMQETDYRVLPNFASRIKAGQPLNIYGVGTQTRTFCYITDAIVGFLLVLAHGVPGDVYNIGNPTPEISMRDLVIAIEKILGRPVDYNVIEYPDSYPADEPLRRCPDIRKARLQLKYEPRISLEEGLRRFFSWSNQAYSGQIQ
ncbi:MAG: NAD-dependent epimerase/dehydratase family protein [Acidobacteria bacterium]|nr:NAD-dependent epimerase/dehydratase family protein [Acidobacteriota bacterium]